MVLPAANHVLAVAATRRANGAWPPVKFATGPNDVHTAVVSVVVTPAVSENVGSDALMAPAVVQI